MKCPKVSLCLKRDDLRKHWNGKFLIAQLTKATKPSNYAHCYFFGRLVPHPTRHERLTVEFGNFEQIVFVVRRKRAQRALAEPILAQFSESYA